MRKHSFAPWIADDEHRPNHETYRIHNDKEIIAHNVTAKNKNLVVTAPDLLKALEGMIESWDVMMTHMPEGVAKECVRGYFLGEPKNAKLVIDKAKGL